MSCFDKFLYFSKIYRHEWIPVNGTRYGGIEICDTQVFRVLTDCQRDPRVLWRYSLVSEFTYTSTQGLVGMGLGHAVIVQSLGYECLWLDV